MMMITINWLSFCPKIMLFFFDLVGASKAEGGCNHVWGALRASFDLKCNLTNFDPARPMAKVLFFCLSKMECKENPFFIQ